MKITHIRTPPSHRVDNGLWLLEDLLLHEAGEGALHDLLDLQHDGRDLPALRGLQVHAPADSTTKNQKISQFQYRA